jgi:Icc-related predicted phosphoesterase
MVAGNHDLTFDIENYEMHRKPNPEVLEGHTPQEIKDVILKEKGIIYLENESIELMGLKIYGSPYSLYFYNWGFPTPEDLEGTWSKIPNDADIVVSHGPPLGILDKTVHGVEAGCKFFRDAIERVKPTLCLFGHIHEARGMVVKKGITYVNGSVLNYNYQYEYPPYIVDLFHKEVSPCSCA